MDYILLIAAITLLLIATRQLSKIKYTDGFSVLKEAKQNIISMLWGTLIVVMIIHIPHRIWVITGSSPYWGGVYIFGGSLLVTIALTFIFYYQSSVRLKTET
ncbi:hypothetical protein [Alkalibacillus almallahensis]|uniref:hypothetical protein n=1 Tax=Alkalibacillus almallahensis TaxID=1379154 RepID=UPI001420CB45|nr:hypothetical protein [Alkalibacillus almallahensis]NIK12621.1 magnesium-transporting ATPase (P-type) [Alkalibacillus almallahensis]